MRKVWKIISLFPTLYIFVIPAYFTGLSYTRPCCAIEIAIIDSAYYNFVTEKEIRNIINNNNGGVLGRKVREISAEEIENRIKTLKELKVAEVYRGIDGTLHVYADQRNPVMRVMALNGNDYYIDDEGFVVRRRNLYTPRLHIVGGNVNITSSMISGLSVLDTSIRYTVLRDIFYLVDYLRNNSFWSAQIDQIYVDSNDEIDLVPRVGNHVIHLGPADDFRIKLKNLEGFYRKVMPEVGWNKYSVINLKYKDQIVCKRR
jgi:cell division protein FtsQ